MPARTGQDYLKGLQEQEREIWLGGEHVKDVTTHPGLRHGAQAIASLYDMQHDSQLRDEMTYVSPTTGDRVGLSFIIPRTMDELELRRTMMLHWARTTCGMMGRSPDFMNVSYASGNSIESNFGGCSAGCESADCIGVSSGYTSFGSGITMPRLRTTTQYLTGSVRARLGLR